METSILVFVFLFCGGRKMHIEIRKLTPDLLEDYLFLFENVVYEDCYCTCYCSDDHTGMDFSSKQVRRDSAVDYIKDGIIQGYLAYCGNQVVGWCNANTKSNCTKCEGWQRILKSVNKIEPSSDKKIKSVFCFIVAPDMRKRGIATRLLESVCKDASEDGFDYVEVYPNKQFIDVYYDHMGPIDLYMKLGFDIFEELEQKIVMRKNLAN